MNPVWQNPIQRTVRTAHLSVLIIVHNCHTQHSTEQFWLSSLLTSWQASQLKYCLLEGRGCLPSKRKTAIYTKVGSSIVTNRQQACTNCEAKRSMSRWGLRWARAGLGLHVNMSAHFSISLPSNWPQHGHGTQATATPGIEIRTASYRPVQQMNRACSTQSIKMRQICFILLLQSFKIK